MKTGDKKRLLLLLWLQKEMLEVLKISQKSLLWCKDQEGTTKSMKEIKLQMVSNQEEIKRLSGRSG